VQYLSLISPANWKLHSFLIVPLTLGVTLISAAVARCVCDLEGSSKTWSLKVDKASVDGPSWAWEVEDSPGMRQMADAVLLPNGWVVIVNGARVSVLLSSLLARSVF
jgi:hypothetical protein